MHCITGILLTLTLKFCDKGGKIMRKQSMVAVAVVVIILWCLGANAYAVLSGSGGEVDPYLIQNLSDFDEFANPANSATYWSSGVYTRLMCDINLTGRIYTVAVIAPDIDSANIGYQGDSFEGAFDGNGHIISNMNIYTTDEYYNYLGLFGQISGSASKIENLCIKDSNIVVSTSTDIGGLCGRNDGGSIENCCSDNVVIYTGEYCANIGSLCGTNIGDIDNCRSVSVNITVGEHSMRIGGLCGLNFQSSIRGCYSTGAIQVANVYNNDDDYYSITLVGGLVGLFDSGEISDCFANVTTRGYSSVGGFCGKNSSGVITNCYARGDVIGSKELGGFCGSNYGSISECYSKGNVNGVIYQNSAEVGGFCGYNRSIITNCYATGDAIAIGSSTMYVGGFCGINNLTTISNSYSTGQVVSSNSYGGFCGLNYNATINDCFWDTQTSGTLTSDGATGKTTAEMQTEATFTLAGWDFVNETANGSDDYWKICDGVEYPTFVWQSLPGNFVCPSNIDLADFAIFAKAWMTSLGDPNYNAICDLTGDDTVNFDDLIIFLENWLGA